MNVKLIYGLEAIIFNRNMLVMGLLYHLLICYVFNYSKSSKFKRNFIYLN